MRWRPQSIPLRLILGIGRVVSDGNPAQLHAPGLVSPEPDPEPQ